MTTFEALNLSPQILQAVKQKGYLKPTVVQQKAIPVILQGEDIFGTAETGTGKTAAFALPLLHLMSTIPAQHKGPRTLILAPTRELAVQIAESFRDYGKNLGLRHTIIFGGVSQHGQTQALRRGVEIIVATPGRLLDLMDQGYVKLNNIEFLVLDEADRMLDMGFIVDIKKITSKIPAQRQTLFFSATVSSEIKKLASALLRNPVSVEVRPTISAVPVEERLYFVDKQSKKDLLCHLINNEAVNHALIFTRTKRGADRLVKSLTASGIRALAIHGDKSQGARQKALNDFKSMKVKILVATDVASRGIDVKELPFVINYDLPEQAETYTHRIGRTARAGASGVAISFCGNDERMELKDIQKYTGKTIPVVKHTFAASGSQQHNDDGNERKHYGKKHNSGGGGGEHSYKRRSHAGHGKTHNKPHEKKHESHHKQNNYSSGLKFNGGSSEHGNSSGEQAGSVSHEKVNRHPGERKKFFGRRKKFFGNKNS